MKDMQQDLNPIKPEGEPTPVRGYCSSLSIQRVAYQWPGDKEPNAAIQVTFTNRGEGAILFRAHVLDLIARLQDMAQDMAAFKGSWSRPPKPEKPKAKRKAKPKAKS